MDPILTGCGLGWTSWEHGFTSPSQGSSKNLGFLERNFLGGSPGVAHVAFLQPRDQRWSLATREFGPSSWSQRQRLDLKHTFLQKDSSVEYGGFQKWCLPQLVRKIRPFEYWAPMDLGIPFLREPHMRSPEQPMVPYPELSTADLKKRVSLRADPPALAGFSVAFAPKQLRGMERRWNQRNLCQWGRVHPYWRLVTGNQPKLVSFGTKKSQQSRFIAASRFLQRWDRFLPSMILHDSTMSHQKTIDVCCFNSFFCPGWPTNSPCWILDN